MSEAALDLDAPETPDVAVLVAERQLRLLQELSEIGMDLARALRRKALAEAELAEAALAAGVRPARTPPNPSPRPPTPPPPSPACRAPSA